MRPPEHTLLVDGDRAGRFIVRRALRALGGACRIDAVRDAARATRALSESPAPDLVILDIRMPRVDGFRFLESLDRRRAWPGTPVIVLVDPAHCGARVLALSFDRVLEVLDKPLRRTQFQAVLARHFGLTLLQALAASPAAKRPLPFPQHSR